MKFSVKYIFIICGHFCRTLQIITDLLKKSLTGNLIFLCSDYDAILIRSFCQSRYRRIWYQRNISSKQRTGNVKVQKINNSVYAIILGNILELHLISWCGNVLERHSFVKDTISLNQTFSQSFNFFMVQFVSHGKQQIDLESK